MLVVKRDSIPMVSYLLSKGASVTARDKKGRNSLMMAGNSVNVDMLAVLIAAKAKIGNRKFFYFVFMFEIM